MLSLVSRDRRRLGSAPATLLIHWIVGQQLVRNFWILTGDKLEFPAEIQRHNLCQEVLQIVWREHDFSLESLCQKILDKSSMSFALPVLPWSVGVSRLGYSTTAAFAWAAFNTLRKSGLEGCPKFRRY